MKVYLVGGAVRDALLGLDAVERDWVVVGSTPEEMEAQGYRRVGRDFPVFLHPENGEDYALARTERKRGRGHRGFECDAGPDVTLEQDLQRRDLTVNAIARDEDGTLIDPFGGVDDVARRVLRHVSDAFGEDPLRVLRVARFAARFHGLGFRVADETLSLMRSMAASGELAELTPERVWNELVLALDTSSPPVFFRVLARCEALHLLFPEIFEHAGVEALDAHPGFRALELADLRSTGVEERFALLWLERSPERLEEFAARFKLPVRFHDLARLVTERGEEIFAWEDASAAELLALIKRVDALRRPERFMSLLNVLQIAAASRGLLVDLAPLSRLVQVQRELDVSRAIEDGEARAIGDRVDAERERAIEKWLGSDRG